MDETLLSAELCRLTIDECFVYKLTNRTANGHRAEDWGLDKPILTGVMKVVQRDADLLIRFYENKKNTMGTIIASELVLFAECPVQLNDKMIMSNFVEPVVDSSRYFVFRVVEPKSKKHMFIGAGFRERQSAFDLRATLQDFEKFIQRQNQAEKASSDMIGGGGEGEEGEASQLPLPPPEFDEKLQLKQGQKIKVNLKMKSGQTRSDKTQSQSSQGSTMLPPPIIKLKPPMSSSSSSSSTPTTTSTSEASAVSTPPTEEDDDEWGDFVGS